MHVYMILYHVQEKRRYVHMEWIFCFRKGNRRNTNKIERRMLPSQIQKLKKSREVQKSLRMLCDSEEDDSSSDDKTFVTLRTRQKVDSHRVMRQNADLHRHKEVMEVNLTDSSGNESLFNTSANSKFYNQDKQRKSKKDQKTKFIQNKKITKNMISSDSDNNSIDLSTNKTTKQKHTSKSNINTEKIINSRNSTYSSDSENDKDVSTNKASNISKNLSNTRLQNKKENINSDAKSTKHKAKKYQDTTSEFEDEDIKYKNQKSKKHSINRTTSYNGNEEKKRKKEHNKSSKKHHSNIQEDESDASSSKEFQKIKLQKVNHDKYTMRRLANLETDYTKSVEGNSAIESKENNDQIDMNFDNAKECVNNCKRIVSNLQKYINSMEQLYGQKDEEQLMLKLIKKVNKLWPNLQKIQRNLTTFYQSKSSKKNLVIKRLPKEVNDDEQSLKETNVCETRTTSENKAHNSENEQEGSSKNVSECDSEEIFSGDESRTLQKAQTIQGNDTSNIENNVNINEAKSNDEDKELIDSSEDENNANKDNMDLQNDLSNSPVLNTSTEKKIKSAEQSIKNQLFSECINNNETSLTDKDIDSDNKQAKSDTDVPTSEIEIEDSPLKNGNQKTVLQNSRQNDSVNIKKIINESIDLFDTSYLRAEENETEKQEPTVETTMEMNYDNPELSSKTSFLLRDSEEENLLNQDEQKKVTSISATREETSDNLEELDVSGKINIDDSESLDDAEALAKKSLLESDSDLDNILDANVVTKSAEGLNIDDLNRIGNNDKSEDDDIDVNSTSTLILSSFLKKTNDKTKITDVKIKTEVEKNDNRQTNEKSLEETNSSNDDAKAEEAAKKALLESNSDESTILSSSDSGENEKKTESNSSRENAKSKQVLLASSNTESSSSELTIEVEASNRLKNSNNSKRHHESDEDSIISKVKRKRLKLNRSHHHWNDKKLRMLCEVRLKRLSRKDLKRYSHALQKSREYLEQKELKRYQDLNHLSLKPLFIVLHHLK